MAKFVQICASQNDLFALDEVGHIHQYNFTNKAWEQLAGARSDEIPTRRDRWAAASAQVTSLDPGDTRVSTRTRESLSATSLRTRPSP